MKRILILAAALVGFLAGASEAMAGGYHANPFNGPVPGQGGKLFHKQPLPAFQAAPWYLYWPYNAHFQTPAPMYNAPYYGPPSAGYGGMVNPYFPQPGYQPGYVNPPVAPAPLK